MIVNVEEIGEFVFKNETSILDEQKIRSLVVNSFKKGYEEYFELERAINDTYGRHIKHNEDVHGKAEANKMLAEHRKLLKQLQTDPDEKKLREEFQNLAKKLTDNRHYQLFLELNRYKIFLEQYARLRVLCIRMPRNFDLEETEFEKQIKILSAFNKAVNEQKLKNKQTHKEE